MYKIRCQFLIFEWNDQICRGGFH